MLLGVSSLIEHVHRVDIPYSEDPFGADIYF
jgi:hypothetical protein